MKPEHTPEARTAPAVAREFTREETGASISLAEANLNRLLEWTSRYDAKAVAILAVDTAMLGYLATVMPPISRWSWFFGVITVMTVALLVASLMFLYMGSYPRTRAPRQSLLFFGTISQQSEDDFSRAFRTRTPEEHLEDALSQCHRIAEILDLKFRHLKRAFGLMLVSIPTWALALFFVLRAS